MSGTTATPTDTAAPDVAQAAAAPGWLRRLWGYMLHHRRDLVFALTAAVLGSACQVVVPLTVKQIVDGVIVQRSSQLWPWLLLLILLGLGIFFFAFVRRYRGGKVALGVQYELRNKMHDHLQSMDLGALGTMPTGQLVARANSDSTLVQGLLSFLPMMSGNVLLLVLSLTVMLFLSPLLALVALVVVPALMFISYHMRRRIFPASWDAQQKEGEVAQIVDEDVNGVRVVKAFGQEERELGRMVEVTEKLYGSQMRSVRLQARFQPLLEAVPSIGQVAVLALGGWMALHHQITLGTFLAFSTYIAQFLAPARQLAGMLTIAQQARAGVERIFQLLDLPPAIADRPDAVPLPPLRGEILFEDVSFDYGADANTLGDGPAPAPEDAHDEVAGRRDAEGAGVLHHLDLRIAPGERVALVGPSGSGKSTVAMLVARLHDPRHGRVLVDGHDVRTVSLASLRSQIGFSFEESFLFSETIGANIAYGRPAATPGEIESAARAAGVDLFVDDLPDGYETMVGERGLSLSGGQRQRIALARALLSEPRILILDDATSAIDARIEETIHDGLRANMADRTTLLIAHRRSTLALADRILVLDEGRIVADGSHEELSESSAFYRSLLSGLDEGELPQDGSIESLAAAMPAGARAGGPGITAAAWSGAGRGARQAFQPSVGAGKPSIGAGLGGGGGGNWRRSLAATPELLAQVAALPPVKDVAAVDVEKESLHDRRFSIFRLLKEFRRTLVLGLVLVVFDALAGLVGPALVRSGVDGGIETGSESMLFMASGIFLVITLADLFNQIAETFVTGRLAQRVMLSLRIRVWAQLQRLSLDYYEREMAGRIMTRMTTDVDQFESLIQNGLLSALVAVVTFVGVGVALILMDAELGLYTLALIVVLAAATVVFRNRSARLYDAARDRIAIVNADFQESLSGVRESQAFVHEAETRRRFHRLNLDYLTTRLAAQRLVATYFPFVQFLAAMADVLVLGIGAGLVVHGHLTTGVLIAFLLYLDMFFSPIQQLSQVFDSWQQTRVSVNRIADLMRLETLTPQAAEPIDPGRMSGEIGFEDVRFSYPEVAARPGAGTGDGPKTGSPGDAENPPAKAPRKPQESLRGINLRIAPGETLALVGETGAGKSTIMKLVARFYDPDGGRVAVDGHALRDLDLPAFRHQLGYVPQESFLFTGTIRDNIAYGRPGASDAEVEAAARAVGAHAFVAQLPAGYLHEIAERGKSLSAGQRQLIALARAELVDPAVLLLDEATSNLDLVTEAHVLAAMQKVSRDRTTILIAHRLQTARTADRIAVVHGGGIAELGSHEELLAEGGRYAAMWETFELVAQR